MQCFDALDIAGGPALQHIQVKLIDERGVDVVFSLRSLLITEKLFKPMYRIYHFFVYG